MRAVLMLVVAAATAHAAPGAAVPRRDATPQKPAVLIKRGGSAKRTPTTRSRASSKVSPAKVRLPAPPAMRADEVGLDEHSALVLRVTHPFPRDTARARLVQLLDYWAEQFQVSSRWQGDQVLIDGTMHGLELRALLEVTDHAVQGLARDPGFPWRTPGVKYVQGKLRKYLHPTYSEPD